MTRTQIAAVVVAGLAFSVYLVTGGTVSQQMAFLGDAGYTGATHRAECPVRIDPLCVARANDAGWQLHTYERLAFPVAVRVLPDGGRDVQMPPMDVGLVGPCIQTVDWNDCTLNAATVASVAGLLGSALPFTPIGVVKTWVRPRRDAGLGCYRSDGDGGAYDYGDRNVFPASQAVDAGDCEFVGAGVIYAGDDPETAL